MKTEFYFKLAASNIRKNSRTYVPYILTCIMTIMMFYIIKSLSINPGLSSIWGGEQMKIILELGVWVIAIFSAIFLFYTNSFLIKNRKKEFGVFNILGMEKRHIAGVILIETLYIAAVTLLLGLGFGMLLDKLMFLTMLKFIGIEVSLGFFISGEAILQTIGIFCLIYLLILVRSIFMIQLSNPIELLRGGKVGEKEPKAKWFSAILGLAMLGGGYYISITTDNPLKALTLFFFAVLLVIFGTYSLFTAGSIAFLKLLKKNKSYYYKTQHFISVSGMIYRMKQNAVGLANICVLSTMVLVMVSSTTSLIIGMDDIINTRYTSDFSVYFMNGNKENSENFVNEIHNIQKENNIKVENESMDSLLMIPMVKKDNSFESTYSETETNTMIDMIFIAVITLDDYNKESHQSKTLNPGEVLIYSSKSDFNYPTVKVFDKEFKVAENLDSYYDTDTEYMIFDMYYIIVDNYDTLSELDKAVCEANGRDTSLQFQYEFDTNINDEEQIDFYKTLNNSFKNNEVIDVTIDCKAEGKTSFAVLYGGLFFLGIFLGTLFTMATALIIYYKQISEGFDDRERFSIMKKVGLSRSEIKSAIHSQILTVFFMPLILAGIHLAAAFPLISRLLVMLQMTNTKLYIYCTVGAFLAFALVYVVIYFLTSKSYYKLVNKDK